MAYAVRIQIDGIEHVGEVHLGRVVAPRTERQATRLVVEWVVRNVDDAHGLEDAARLPVDGSRAVDDGTELVVLLVNVFRSANTHKTSIKHSASTCGPSLSEADAI